MTFKTSHVIVPAFAVGLLLAASMAGAQTFSVEPARVTAPSERKAEPDQNTSRPLPPVLLSVTVVPDPPADSAIEGTNGVKSRNPDSKR